MNIEQEIIKVFPEVLVEPIVTNEFIEENQNLMEIPNEINHIKYVPSYMLWCLRKKESELVDMYTINALAEYGRSKAIDNNYLNFKHLCSPSQKNVVVSFLNWCLKELYTVEKEQIERAVKNWSK